MKRLFEQLGSWSAPLSVNHPPRIRGNSGPVRRVNELAKFIRRADGDAVVRAAALIVLLLLLAVLRR